MIVSMDKKYTSNGRPVRILCTDMEGDYPVVTAIEGSAVTFTSEGKYHTNDSCIKDLKEVWTPTKGEWCYFWDYSNRGLAVCTFDHMRNTNTYVDSIDMHWEYCAPFDGKLPEGFMK